MGSYGIQCQINGSQEVEVLRTLNGKKVITKYNHENVQAYAVDDKYSNDHEAL
jgi:hypothetical protein